MGVDGESVPYRRQVEQKLAHMLADHVESSKPEPAYFCPPLLTFFQQPGPSLKGLKPSN